MSETFWWCVAFSLFVVVMKALTILERFFRSMSVPETCRCPTCRRLVKKDAAASSPSAN
jgi:hypothetical protein